MALDSDDGMLSDKPVFDKPVFDNPVLAPVELPALPDDAFNPVERSHLRAQLGILAACVAVGAIAAIVVAAVGSSVVAFAAVVALLIGALSAWALVVSFNHRGWLIREHDISYRSGVISRSVETVPFSRVQHTSVDAGPIDRSLGLAKLSVFSASGGGADLVISGLRHDDAVRLRERVSEAAAGS